MSGPDDWELGQERAAQHSPGGDSSGSEVLVGGFSSDFLDEVPVDDVMLIDEV